MLASALGTWMQIVAQSLLVLRLTGNSALALGTVSLAQASAFFLFAPVGGAFADRHDKRRLLFRTQTLLMLSAFTLAVLTASGAVRLWMVVVLAFVSGVLLSFDQPARASLLPLLAPPEDFDECHFFADAGLQRRLHSGSSSRRGGGLKRTTERSTTSYVLLHTLPVERRPTAGGIVHQRLQWRSSSSLEVTTGATTVPEPTSKPLIARRRRMPRRQPSSRTAPLAVSTASEG